MAQPPPQYSPDRRWWWNGTQWIAVSADGTSLGSTSLLLAIWSWIAACGGFAILAGDPNVTGGIAWQMPSPLLAVGSVVVGILSMRATGRAHIPPRQTATIGVAVGAVNIVANAGYWSGQV